jgi:hypothetical protein
MEARTTAYQEAGIANQETVVVSPTAGSESKAPVRALAATATLNAPEGAKPKPAWTSPQVVINAPLAPPTLQVRASAPQARAPSPSPAATVAQPAPTKPAAETVVAAANPPTSATPVQTAKVPVAAMAAEKAPPKVTAVSAAPATWADAKITTSALAPVAAPLPVPVRKAEPTAPPRLQVASVAPFLTQVSAEPAPDPIWLPASINAVALPPAASEVRLLVGAAHSRSEAFALLVRLTSQRGAALGPRRPQIADATPPGSDPLYRLRLGPFEAGHAQTLCRSLNDSGYPCAVE